MANEYDEAEELMKQVEKIATEIESQYWVRTGRYPDDTPHLVDLGAAVLFLQKQIDELRGKHDD